MKSPLLKLMSLLTSIILGMHTAFPGNVENQPNLHDEVWATLENSSIVKDEIAYTVSFNVNNQVGQGGGSVQGAGNYIPGQWVEAIAHRNPGFKFLHWSDHNNNIVSHDEHYMFQMPAHEIALTAVFSDKVALIDVSPMEIIEYMNTGEISHIELLISNIGSEPLSYLISLDTQKKTVGNNTNNERNYVLSKGEKDTRHGKPVTKASGGPDEFGYFWVDSDDPSGPQYVWNCIATTGVFLSTVSNCDDCIQIVNLGFDFPYYGDHFSIITVESNGFITAGIGYSEYWNEPLPSIWAPPGIIAGFWTDLYPGLSADSRIYFQDFGNYAVVQYDAVRYYTGPGTVTFQIHIYESGEIRFYYKEISGAKNTSTIGMQNLTQDIGLQIVYNADYIKDEHAIVIKETAGWISVEPEQGTIEGGQSHLVEVTLDATGLWGGVYEAVISISSNDLDNPLIQVPVYMDVTDVPVISLSHETLDFGNMLAGTLATLPLSIANIGTQVLEISNIATTGAGFSVDGFQLSLSPGQSHELVVTFQSDEEGVYEGMLSFNTNIEGQEDISIPLYAEIMIYPVTFTVVNQAGQFLENAMITVYGSRNLNTGNSGLLLRRDSNQQPTGISKPTTGSNTGHGIQLELSGDTNAGDLPSISDDNRTGEWIKYWQTGVNDNALGLGGTGAQWFAAIRWMPDDLIAYQNHSVTKIRIFINDLPLNGFATIWQGNINDPFVMRSQAFTPVSYGWAEIVLNNPYLIDTSQELWIGWEIGDPGAGVFPAAFETSSQFDQLANLLQFGDNPWQFASQYGFQVVWNIEAYVEPPSVELAVLYTDANGQAIFDAYAGNYSYTIEKDDHTGMQGNFIVGNQPVDIFVTLLSDQEFPTVTFYLDMTGVEGFNPHEDDVYLTGTFSNWAVPGSPGSIQMSLVRSDKTPETLIYTASIYTTEGHHEYKYFSNAFGDGWDGGEWHGDPNRIIVVEDDMQVFNIWGQMHGWPYSVSLTADPDNGGTVEGAGNYLPGQWVEVSAQTNPGFMFLYWTDHNDHIVCFDTHYIFQMPDNAVTLTANFTDQAPIIDVAPELFEENIITDQVITRTLTVYNNGAEGSMLIAQLGIDNLRKNKNASAYYKNISHNNITASAIKSNTSTDNSRSSYSGDFTITSSDEFTRKDTHHIFFNDFEDNIDGWYTETYSGQDLWHISSLNYASPLNSLWCGINGSNHYDTGSRVNTAIITPLISLPENSEFIYLDFWEYYETEPGYDYCMVDISTNNGNTWVHLRGSAYNDDAPSGSSGGWINTVIDLLNYAGQDIRIRFYFDTIDEEYNFFPGWFVDDVAVAVSHSHEWLLLNEYELVIPGGEFVEVEVLFDAENMHGGTYEAFIYITSNDPGNPLVHVPVTMHVTGIPGISLSHEMLDFGNNLPGTLATLPLTITSTGTDVLEISNIATSGVGFSAGDTHLSLPIGQSYDLMVSFQTDEEGVFEGILSFNTNVEGQESISIPLYAEIVIYPVTFSVVNQENQPVENAMITVYSNRNQNAVTAPLLLTRSSSPQPTSISKPTTGSNTDPGIRLELSGDTNGGYLPSYSDDNRAGEWIKYWLTGVNDNALGLGGTGAQWFAAIRWMPNDLIAYQNHSVTKIRIFINDLPLNGFATIWQGNLYNPVVMRSQAFVPVNNNWAEIELNNPYMIDTSQELWIGWEIGDPGDGVFPAAFETSTEFNQLANLLQYGNNPWEFASLYGFDVVWNIEAFVKPPDVEVAVLYTDANGQASLDLIPGTYSYMVQKAGYFDADGTFSVSDAPVAIDVTMQHDSDAPLVTFNVDMTGVAGFDPAQHNVYLTGTFTGWAEPGSPLSIEMNPAKSHKNRNELIYSASIYTTLGHHEYKYFSNAFGDGWDGGEWPGDPNREIYVTGDMVVNDVWGGPTYHIITATSSDGGHLEPEGEILVLHGFDQEFLVITDAGHHIQDVLVDGMSVSAVENYVFTNVIAGHTIHAVFGINTYLLHYVAGENGYLEGDTEQAVEHGSSGTPVQAVPNAGYQFDQWSDGVMDNPRTDENVTEDMTLTAYFEQITSIAEINRPVLIIHPNPAHDKLYVKVLNHRGQSVSVALINIHGQTVLAGMITEADEGQISLDIQSLAAGLYMVKVQVDSDTVFEKVVIR